MMRGMVLAIETSQRNASVALGALSLEVKGGACMSEPVDTSDRNIEDVLPAIERLFTRSQVKREHIGALAINQGPGGFTGLRIAHAAAQVIAQAWSIPVVQISAAVVAREAAVLSKSISADQTVWVALAAKGDGCWMARVSNPHQGNDLPEHVGVLDEDHWPLGAAEALIADEHLPASWREKARVSAVSIIDLRPSAEAVLHVARRQLARGHHVAPEHILPVYPREAEAVRLWRERQGPN